MDIQTVELKNVKIHPDMSQETTCFSATLYVNGQRTAAVRNDGQGGCDMMDPTQDKGALERLRAFEAWCKTQPKIKTDFASMPELDCNAELYVARLLEEHEQQKWMKRQTKTKILFRLEGDEEKVYRTVPVKGAGTPEVRQKFEAVLRERFGDKLIELH